MTNPYWLQPTEVRVPCGSAEHVLRWAEGELTAVDHDDIDGELALGALGGEQLGCARIVGAWRAAMHDPRLLTLASRGKRDQLTVQPSVGWVSLSAFGGAPMPARRPGRLLRAQSWATARPAPFPGGGTASFGSASFATVSYAAPAVAVSAMKRRHEQQQEDPLVMLLRMPALADRLVYGVVLAWTSRLAAGTAPSDILPTLTAALIGRVRCVTRDWLSDLELRILVSMLPPGTPPTFATDADGTVRIGVPFGWLAGVWAPELTTIYGRFTLAAERDGNTVTLDTVGPRGDRGPTVIRLP